MEDRITCFKLNWYDCGLSCPEDMVQEEITIYRKDKHMAIKQLNGYGVICSCKIIRLEKEKVDKFFRFLEKISNEWESDYKVLVCDGSSWEIRMWHSSHRIKKVCGTIKYPPHGKRVEKYIRSFIAESKEYIHPIVFGCCNY